MAKRNVLIHEGGTIKTLSEVAKIKTYLAEGDFCYWVPEDAVRLGTLTVSMDGTYRASDSGYYGYSEVTVTGAGTAVMGDLIVKEEDIEENGTYEYVASKEGHYGYSIVRLHVNVGNHSTSKDPETGEDVDTRPDPVTGLTTTTTLPYLIHVDTLPNKTVYLYGDQIDYTGIEVYAYLRSGEKWTSDEYPNGRIPFDELILPTQTAGDYSAGGYPSSNPGGGVIDPAVQGDNTSVDYKQSGVYTVESVGSINANIVAALTKLGTTRSGMSSADIANLVSDYQGVNPAIVTINYTNDVISGVVMSIYVFTGITTGMPINLGGTYNCKVINITGTRTENKGDIVLSYANTTDASSIIFTGGKSVGTIDLSSTLSTVEYDSDIGNLNTWTKRDFPSGLSISYNQPVNTVSGPMVSGYYERIFKEVTVTPNTDYVFSYGYIGHEFTEKNGTGHITYVSVTTTMYTGYTENASRYIIAKLRTYDSGYYELKFNSGDHTSLYLCIDWAAVTDGTQINLRYYDLALYPTDSSGDISPDDPGGGGEQTPINPSTTITQNLRVEWKRPLDFKLLTTAFPITVTSRIEEGWENP